MDILHSVLVALHLLGMAAIVGAFFVQMRRKDGFVIAPMLAGAITQVVTGVALVGLAEASDSDLIYAKIGVKLAVAVVVLAAVIVATVVQRRGGRVNPWFHAAGGLAVINVLVAVFWN
jgi:hypothetical protein